MSTASQFAPRSIRSPALIIPTSRAITIAVAGIYRVSALGGGGSGACGLDISNFNPQAAAGGGGGAFVESENFYPAGTVLTFTIAAGGAGVTRSTAGITAGNAGGSTTVTASGYPTLTAGGGGGGGVSQTVSTTANGGVGGTASGGNVVNTSGGVGGSATVGTVVHSAAGGGGGAGSPYGNGGRGGNATTPNSAGQVSAGGGGSIEGWRGGDSSTNAVHGTGAGAGGNGNDNNNSIGGASRLGQNTSNGGLGPTGTYVDGIGRGDAVNLLNFETLFDPFRALNCGGGCPGVAAHAPAAGGFGVQNGANAMSGPFAGTGGIVCSTSSGTITGIRAGFGGGGGGIAAVVWSSGTLTSIPGGNGLAAIERIG
jgi:hypothetical protein